MLKTVKHLRSLRLWTGNLLDYCRHCLVLEKDLVSLAMHLTAQKSLLESPVNLLLMRLEILYKIEEVSGDLQVFIYHELDLLLDDCVHLGRMHVALLITQHQLQCINRHSGLPVELAAIHRFGIFAGYVKLDLRFATPTHKVHSQLFL